MSKVLDTIEDPTLRQQFSDFIDGTNGETTADVVYTAWDLGHELTMPIVRRHRRRITRNGEACWCPLPRSQQNGENENA